jgi:hypothetical protein
MDVNPKIFLNLSKLAIQKKAHLTASGLVEIKLIKEGMNYGREE